MRPEIRLSATQALDHSWLSICETVKPSLEFSVSGLVNYMKLDKMQKLVVAYLASRTSDAELTKQMFQFVDLDKERNGYLSREDLENVIMQIKKRFSDEKDVFAEMDINQSYSVEYLGIIRLSRLLDFVAASLPEYIITNEGLLTDAFEFFDKVGPRLVINRMRTGRYVRTT